MTDKAYDSLVSALTMLTRAGVIKCDGEQSGSLVDYRPSISLRFLLGNTSSFKNAGTPNARIEFPRCLKVSRHGASEELFSVDGANVEKLFDVIVRTTSAKQ